MAKIGRFDFNPATGSYLGCIYMFGFCADEVSIVPAAPQPGKASAPSHRLMWKGFEIGAGWVRPKQGGGTYISIGIDSPLLPSVIYCALFSNEGRHELTWRRQNGGSSGYDN